MISEKDSVINGKTCSVINIADSSNFYYLCQEEDRVYMWFDDSFHKIFDFTVETGDSVELAAFTLIEDLYTLTTVKCRVENVSYTSTYGMPLKYVYVSYKSLIGTTEHYSYIEKLGSPEYITFIPEVDLVYTQLDVGFMAYEDNELTWVDIYYTQLFPDMLCDYPGKASSVDNIESRETVIFPNPVGDMFNIETLQSDNATDIQICDISGKTVHTQKFDRQINIAFLSSGVYFVKLFNSSNLLLTLKFIKI
ncbi:hypothetical protein FACS1894180_4390 [Bacteroidia bacterium]|nr:hypothetical protein FACS1894180_4390 [Bacteroidia bacterium]